MVWASFHSYYIWQKSPTGYLSPEVRNWTDWYVKLYIGVGVNLIYTNLLLK